MIKTHLDRVANYFIFLFEIDVRLDKPILAGDQNLLLLSISLLSIHLNTFQAGNSKEADDRAAECFDMQCEDDSQFAGTATSGTRGAWRVVSCPADHVVCGLQTAVQDANDGRDDMVGLMDIRLHCCPLVTVVHCGPASAMANAGLDGPVVALTPVASNLRLEHSL